MGQSIYTQIYAYLTDDQLLRLEDVMKHMGVTLHSDMISKLLADYELPARPTNPCHQTGRVCEEAGSRSWLIRGDDGLTRVALGHSAGQSPRRFMSTSLASCAD